MGKKVIFKGVDFSENAIVVNLLMKIKAGESFTYEGVTYSGGTDGAYYELNDVPATFGSSSAQNYLQELKIGKPYVELGRQYCMNQTSLEKVTFGDNVYFEEISYNMFKGCSSLKTILGTPNLSRSKRLNGCFSGCTSLEENIDLSTWQTSTIQYFSQMFIGCSNLKSINISSFSTQSATTMESMFSGCTNLETLVLGDDFNLNIQDLNCSGMFYQCNKLAAITAPNCQASDYNVSETTTYALVSAITGSAYHSSRKNTPLVISCKNGGTLTGTYVNGTGWSWVAS
jgi:surface protein